VKLWTLALDTRLKGEAHFTAPGPIYIFTIALLLVLMIVAAIIRHERFHAAFAIFFFAYLLVFITINL